MDTPMFFAIIIVLLVQAVILWTLHLLVTTIQEMGRNQRLVDVLQKNRTTARDTACQTDEHYDIQEDKKYDISSDTQTFIEYLHSFDEQDSKEWHIVTQSELPLRVVKTAPSISKHCFALKAHLQCPPKRTFQVLTDVDNRASWDLPIEESKIIEQIDDKTRVVYIKMKPIWPLQARDMVLLSFINTIKNPFGEGKAYVNITKSITHHSVPPLTGVVRMKSKISGQLLCSGDLDVTDIEKSKSTMLYQLANADPGSYVPPRMIMFILTKVLPRSLQTMEERVSIVQRNDLLHLKVKNVLRNEDKENEEKEQVVEIVDELRQNTDVRRAKMPSALYVAGACAATATISLKIYHNWKR